MKKAMFDNGWDNITTERFRITGPYKALQAASFWVDFVTRMPQMNKGGRNHCQRCSKKWSEVPPETMTYFVQTNKGNTVVCQECFEQLFPQL